MIDKLLSRKLIAMVLLCVAATVLLYLEKIGADHWVEFVQWVFGFYAAGNVGEHVADAVKGIKGTP